MVKHVLIAYKQYYQVLNNNTLVLLKNAQANFPKVKSDVAKAANFVRNDLPQLEQRLTNATASVNKNLPTLLNGYDQAVGLLNKNQPQAKKGFIRFS